MTRHLFLAFAALLVTEVSLAAAADEAAHQRYAQVLAQVESDTLTVSPRINRLIGWPGTAVQGLSAAQRLDWLLGASWDWEMSVRPERATFTGFPGQNGRWLDRAPDNLAQIEALETRSLRAAQAIPADELDAEQQLNLALFIDQRRGEVAGHAFPEEWLPVNQMVGVQTLIPQVLGAMPLFTEAQLEDYLQRLAGIPTLLEQVRQDLERGLAAGITPPRVTLAKVPAQLRGLIPERALDSPLLAPLRQLDPALAKRSQAQQRALDLYRQDIAPAVRGLGEFLEQHYLPGARESIAFTALPDGEDWYAWQVRQMTTTDLSPREIHKIGLAEVERIAAAMREIMAELDHQGSIADFVALLYSESQHFYRSEQALLTDYRAKAKLADGRLPRLFRRFAALPYAIEALPAFESAGKPAAYYLPGSAENGRPGTFYLNSSRLAETPRFETEALLLHEAVPGHHFQIALAQELENLPPFRQHARFTAYIEGWGLYAESLGPELGFYTDPYSRFGALSFEMWRAVRLVVDTGMHALGWSRQQAIDYFHAQTGRGRQRIETEIDRYLVMPGQALAYKIGELRIKALRQRASEALGEAFDLRAFHDLILGAGALPLDVLEQRVETWIASEEAA